MLIWPSTLRHTFRVFVKVSGKIDSANGECVRDERDTSGVLRCRERIYSCLKSSFRYFSITSIYTRARLPSRIFFLRKE